MNQSFITEIINKRRESIREAFGDNLARFIEFKRLYDEAIRTKDIEKIKKALKFYNDHKEQIMKSYSWKKAIQMAKELQNLLNDYYTKNKIDVNLNAEKIKKVLKSIIMVYNNNQKIVARLQKYKISKLHCIIFEEGDKDCIFEIIVNVDQLVRSELSDIIYDIGKDLEKKLPVATDIGDGDEGCLYINW